MPVWPSLAGKNKQENAIFDDFLHFLSARWVSLFIEWIPQHALPKK